MAVVRVTTEISASPERVFDLSRDVQPYTRSMGSYGEELVAGVA